MYFHGPKVHKKPFKVYYGIFKPGELVYRRPYESWAPAYVSRYKEFFDSLRESLKREGVRNPVMCQHTRVIYGNSRAWIATEENIDIPALLMDFNGELQDRGLESITTREQALSKFKDEPHLVFNLNSNEFNFHVTNDGLSR